MSGVAYGYNSSCPVSTGNILHRYRYRYRRGNWQYIYLCLVRVLTDMFPEQSNCEIVSSRLGIIVNYIMK